MRRCRVQSRRIRRRAGAAKFGISNDRRLNERRSARLEEAAVRRRKNCRDAVDMLDRARDKQHRQLHQSRQKRRRCQMDGRANRAIIVGVARGMVRRRRRAGRLRARYFDAGRVDIMEMDVPE